MIISWSYYIGSEWQWASPGNKSVNNVWIKTWRTASLVFHVYRTKKVNRNKTTTENHWAVPCPWRWSSGWEKSMVWRTLWIHAVDDISCLLWWLLVAVILHSCCPVWVNWSVFYVFGGMLNPTLPSSVVCYELICRRTYYIVLIRLVVSAPLEPFYPYLSYCLCMLLCNYVYVSAKF